MDNKDVIDLFEETGQIIGWILNSNYSYYRTGLCTDFDPTKKVRQFIGGIVIKKYKISLNDGSRVLLAMRFIAHGGDPEPFYKQVDEYETRFIVSFLGPNSPKMSMTEIDEKITEFNMKKSTITIELVKSEVIPLV